MNKQASLLQTIETFWRYRRVAQREKAALRKMIVKALQKKLAG